MAVGRVPVSAFFRGATTTLALQVALAVACPSAGAADVAFLQALDGAKAKIEAKDYRGAERLLDDAKTAAPQSAQLIMSEDLSRMLFYRGVAEWYGGDRDRAALDAWRATAVLNPAYQPDAKVLPDTEAQDAFYAIVSEVKGYTEAQLNIPEDLGDSMLFIDGARKEVGDTVRTGEHFLQLRCGEGNVVGAWYTYGIAPPDYAVLCSGGVYPGAKVRPTRKGETAAGTKGSDTKSPAEAVATPPAEVAVAESAAATKKPKNKEPVAKEPVAAKETVAAKTAAPKVDKTPVVKEDAPPAEKVPADKKSSSKVGGYALMGVGAAMLGTGAAVNFLVVNSAWDAGQRAIEAPATVSPAEAQAIESRFNTGKWTTIALLAGGAISVGTGVVLGPLHTTWTISPAGLGVHGIW